MCDLANPVNEPRQPNAMEESGERESVGQGALHRMVVIGAIIDLTDNNEEWKVV
jgi:hypothetical protein